ncbi:MAG: hypothetical protein WDO24_00270 [Pseudomonadota bacterium]
MVTIHNRAVEAIRNRVGWDAIGYGSVTLGVGHSVPDAFRELAERDLRSHAPTVTARLRQKGARGESQRRWRLLAQARGGLDLLDGVR